MLGLGQSFYSGINLMRTAADFRVLTFLGLIAVVYLLAASTLVRMLLQRLGYGALSKSPVQTWLRRIVLSFAALGLLCGAYGYFIEPYWLSVSHVRIKSHKLPRGTEPLRIVHISDIHSDPGPRLERRLPQAIAAERPDIIVFTGDSLNSPEGLPVFRECMTALARIAPTFVVKGNWDAWYWNQLNLFGETGVYEMDGNSLEVQVRGFSFWVAGVAVENENQLESAIRFAPPDAFKVFLYHYPDLIREAAGQKVDLYCAGHTHGGQVALPFYGALITFSKYGKKYEAGLYREDETWLYVNRGIGMEGGHAPRVRFWARPEITVIEVWPES
jgi:predicted MPP superfamily phosphohydrolase